jgi:hypothetical protein
MQHIDHETRAGDCPASARVPSLISRMVAHPATGQSELLLWDEDGTSWAECDYEPGAGHFALSSYGPRRLRAEAEDAFRWWVSCGSPSAESFGLIVSAEGQHVWPGEPERLI